MTISIVEGNLLTSKELLIGHQVNCKGWMGKGIAAHLANSFPAVYFQYKTLCKENANYSRKLLGETQFVKVKDDRIVANLFGQDGVSNVYRKTEYWAIQSALINFRIYAVNNGLSMALPYGIGCNVAGGDWNTVANIIKEVFEDVDLTLYRKDA